MSRSVDLFIDTELSLEEVADALGRQAGSPLVSDGQATWLLQDGAVRATLAEHPYGDDGELLFTRYRFALSARLTNQGRTQDSAEAALLRRIAQKVQQNLAWPVLVVHDLQYRDRPATPHGPDGEVPATAPTGGGAG
jgi:hypothetical protein